MTWKNLLREKGDTMDTKKAYIKLDGSIGEKDQPAIEYVDENHDARLGLQKKRLDDLIAGVKYHRHRRWLDYAAEPQKQEGTKCLYEPSGSTG
jgi:hypothetical protein